MEMFIGKVIIGFVIIITYLIYWGVGYFLTCKLIKFSSNNEVLEFENSGANFFCQNIWPIAIPLHFVHKSLPKENFFSSIAFLFIVPTYTIVFMILIYYVNPIAFMWLMFMIIGAVSSYLEK